MTRHDLRTRHIAARRYYRPCASLPIAGESTTPADDCAGGNRVSGGAPGNGVGREAASLDYAIGPHEEWEAPALALRPDQVDWLSHDDRKLVLDDLAFKLEDALNQLRSHDEFDAGPLRDFFMNDYMRCVYLISELDFRLNKL